MPLYSRAGWSYEDLMTSRSLQTFAEMGSGFRSSYALGKLVKREPVMTFAEV